MSEVAHAPAPALFSLQSGRPLLERICAQLGLAPAPLEERDFEDGEHKLRPLESVRGPRRIRRSSRALEAAS